MVNVALFHHSDRNVGINLALKQMALTHKSKKLVIYATSYLNLVFDVIEKQPTPLEFRVLVYSRAMKDLKIDIRNLVESKRQDRDIVGGVFSTACYIEDSYPAILYLSAKYAESYEDSIISNVNVGGYFYYVAL